MDHPVAYLVYIGRLVDTVRAAVTALTAHDETTVQIGRMLQSM